VKNWKEHAILEVKNSPAANSSLRFGCWSFPGRVFNQKGRGQFIGITRGPRGCAANQREIMKVFVHALGFRMVQNRPDRDRYIKINYEFMAPGKSEDLPDVSRQKRWL
jgi:Astacin (Peptidase family M12A)